MSRPRPLAVVREFCESAAVSEDAAEELLAAAEVLYRCSGSSRREIAQRLFDLDRAGGWSVRVTERRVGFTLAGLKLHGLVREREFDEFALTGQVDSPKRQAAIYRVRWRRFGAPAWKYRVYARRGDAEKLARMLAASEEEFGAVDIVIESTPTAWRLELPR